MKQNNATHTIILFLVILLLTIITTYIFRETFSNGFSSPYCINTDKCKGRPFGHGIRCDMACGPTGGCDTMHVCRGSPPTCQGACPDMRSREPYETCDPSCPDMCKKGVCDASTKKCPPQCENNRILDQPCDTGVCDGAPNGGCTSNLVCSLSSNGGKRCAAPPCQNNIAANQPCGSRVPGCGTAERGGCGINLLCTNNICSSTPTTQATTNLVYPYTPPTDKIQYPKFLIIIQNYGSDYDEAVRYMKGVFFSNLGNPNFFAFKDFLERSTYNHFQMREENFFFMKSENAVSCSWPEQDMKNHPQYGEKYVVTLLNDEKGCSCRANLFQWPYYGMITCGFRNDLPITPDKFRSSSKLSHEFGHNLGFYHSSAANDIDDLGPSHEYSDLFSVMGLGNYSRALFGLLPFHVDIILPDFCTHVPGSPIDIASMSKGSERRFTMNAYLTNHEQNRIYINFGNEYTFISISFFINMDKLGNITRDKFSRRVLIHITSGGQSFLLAALKETEIYESPISYQSDPKNSYIIYSIYEADKKLGGHRFSVKHERVAGDAKSCTIVFKKL